MQRAVEQRKYEQHTLRCFDKLAVAIDAISESISNLQPAGRTAVVEGTKRNGEYERRTVGRVQTYTDGDFARHVNQQRQSAAVFGAKSTRVSGSGARGDGHQGNTAERIRPSNGPQGIARSASPSRKRESREHNAANVGSESKGSRRIDSVKKSGEGIYNAPTMQGTTSSGEDQTGIANNSNARNRRKVWALNLLQKLGRSPAAPRDAGYKPLIPVASQDAGIRGLDRTLGGGRNIVEVAETVTDRLVSAALEGQRRHSHAISGQGRQVERPLISASGFQEGSRKQSQGDSSNYPQSWHAGANPSVRMIEAQTGDMERQPEAFHIAAMDMSRRQERGSRGVVLSVGESVRHASNSVSDFCCIQLFSPLSVSTAHSFLMECVFRCCFQ
jgi:hypothetical protein